MIHWGLGQKGKGEHSRYSATELVMQLEVLGLEGQKEK